MYVVNHRSLLGVGAYDGKQLIGFAACSADCDTMWQIGVDVLPQYRRKFRHIRQKIFRHKTDF